MKAQPLAAVESSHHLSGERVDSSGPGGDVPVKKAQVVEPTTKSHAPVEEHDEIRSKKTELAKLVHLNTHSWLSGQ